MTDERREAKRPHDFTGRVPHLSEADLSAAVPADILADTLFEWVEIERVFVPAYGRPYSQDKVNDLLRRWDDRAIGTLYLSFRHTDNTFALIDGQHRLFAAKVRGWAAVPARIWIDLSYEDEATLYNLFASVHKQTALDRFRAKIEAKDPDALALRGLFLAIGMDIALKGTGPNRVSSVQALEAIVAHYGFDHLRKMVRVLYDGWGNSGRAWVSDMLNGFAAFYARYEALVKPDRLLERLRSTTPDRVLVEANANKLTRSKMYSKAAVGIELWTLYNQGLRSTAKLPAWEETHYTDRGMLAIQASSAARRRERHKDWADAITRHLAHHHEQTFAELLAGTGISQPTMATVLAELMEDGVVSRRAIRGVTNSLVYLYMLVKPAPGEAAA